jgi:hypothetical protein
LGRQVFVFEPFLLFTECVHPLLWLFFCFNIQKWNLDFITCYSYNVTKKVIAKSKPFCAHRKYLQNSLCAKLVNSIAWDNFFENSAQHLW